MSKRSERFSAGRSPTPAEFVALWPTPMASSGRGPGKHGKGGPNLQTAVNLWPTPRTAGMCGGTGNWAQLKEKCEGIEESRQMGAGNGGQLNPDWVEALMGYPQGWTNIERENVTTDANYPGAWVDGSWEEGIPRVLPDVKNRVSRLKCLGNAVVPQIPALLWILVLRALWT